MCDLCSSGNDLVKARTKCHDIAELLTRMAQMYRGFAVGSIKPHTDEAKDSEMRARELVRVLVAEWV